MDLFTVDTVGEKDLLDRDESNSAEILYTNKEYVENNDIEDEVQDEKSSVDESDEQDNEEDYDYHGKCNKF